MTTLTVPITTEYIELNQLLKLAGLAESGGAGGAMVTAGGVTVDGEAESRKRAKLRVGQVVRVGEHEITVTQADDEAMAVAREKDARKSLKARQAKAPWGPRQRKPAPRGGKKKPAKPAPR